jgi:hypothetical protein
VSEDTGLPLPSSITQDSSTHTRLPHRRARSVVAAGEWFTSKVVALRYRNSPKVSVDVAAGEAVDTALDGVPLLVVVLAAFLLAGRRAIRA